MTPPFDAPPAGGAPEPAPKANEEIAVSVPVVGVGASAGGLEALREMLGPARTPLGLALVVVQHLDPNYESMLAQLLDRQTGLEVLQCEGGERIEADTVYIIPPGRGLAIRSGRLELTDFAQPRGLRRPIDDFFISLAADQQVNAACVILSGTGADGSTGLRAIKEHGGVCVVQQPDSARYDGMPVSAVGTGLVDFIKPPGEILECLSGFFTRRARGGETSEPEAALVADHVDELCQVLRTAVGHDFSGYKRSTLIRRVERRMHVLGLASARAYLTRVRNDAEECEALLRDLLINVTRFFRDPERFETLREKVIEPLVRDRRADEDIRVWVPGCSSGEEAYTIAILFAEAARTSGRPLGLQIFATDIDEQMLQVARDGSYPTAALADVPVALRERYLNPHADRFAVNGYIRDLVRFSNHSLVKDPPFSRVDLVSCRNLLIYFADRLQQSVLPLLHYAIRPCGFLFLGPSESVGRFEHLFPSLDAHARIFERSPGAPVYPIDLPGAREVKGSRRSDLEDRSARPKPVDESVAVRQLIDRHTPPSMVLDADGAILAAYGRLSRYFEFPITRTGGSGAITLARPGLRNVLGPLLRQARDGGRTVVARQVEVASEYGVQQIEVVCDPLSDGTLLFVFRESAAFEPSAGVDLTELGSDDSHIETLEEELRLTRHRLRSAVEELETANEELKSSNEEMMSMNEELQSTNEELTTVNDELKGKVSQVTVANADLRNFVDSTELAVVMMDDDLRVRSFTAAATSIFPLLPSDRGRPLAEVNSRLADASFLVDAAEVARGSAPVQRRVCNRDGDRTLSLRVLPYKTHSGTVNGVTLVLTDITDALALERELASEQERLDLAVRAAGIAIWEYRPDTGEISTDATGSELLGLDASRVSLNDFVQLFHRGDRASIEAGLERAAADEEVFESELEINTAGREGRWIKAFGRLAVGGEARRVVGVATDVTAQHQASEMRELMLREMNHRVKNLFAVVAGIVSLGARSHADVTTFGVDIRERIASLGRAHSLASTRTGQQAVGLTELIEVLLTPYDNGGRLQIKGPVVDITAASLSPLALILHEWATNSVKYGALGSREGKLGVSWSLRDDGLVIDWLERGGPVGPSESGAGFGTLLVDSSTRQLQASLSRLQEAGSYRLQLTLPHRALERG